jgi:stearoyl-CoA desaturase (delta-9 desaturase)
MFGILDFSLWQYVVAALVLTHITIAAVTLYLHRCQAHRGIELHPIVSHFFRFWLWLTTGMVTKEWVAIHRKHHAKCETEDDPHSPMVKGIKTVFWQGAELYRAEAHVAKTMEDYGHNTPDDWLERNVYSKRSKYGIVLMLLLDILLFGIPGITIWAVQMIWIPLFAAGVINGIGHYWGYRNFEVADASTNIIPVGILIGGEEMHNNHHAFGSSSKFSVKWWEFDIGWMYIQIMRFFGLAKVKKVAPKPIINESKGSIDTDAVMAIITNRLQVMSTYAKNVMVKVYKDEVRDPRTSNPDLIKGAKALLIRDEFLMDEKQKRSLKELLDNNSALQTVYVYRERLQDIWQKTTASQEQLLQALQEWCQQAETSGIKYLQEFAKSLKGYTLQPA